ncbi:SRPBCC domain-containing protein [Phenylobacterium sp.]|uniref:SRPBCC family protein n=1 Tax=Phenylobacterium sp. TaxID=1871053 RepID=UPI002D116A2E|nr:SRPBCC domain-containing protein [Phenylobacterium sp.]HLZ73935.1 SRPBCC domain-containing protein [Phenylobacterium sp.]
MSRALAIAAAVSLTAGAALADGAKADLAAVRDTSSVEASGARILQDTVAIHAPAAAVWKALTDQASYRAWVAPGSFIDFRVGGRVDVAFDPKAKAGDPPDISQEIIAYLPGRMIAFRNLKTPPLPGAAAYPKLAIVMALNPLPGGDTEVSLSQVGYGGGAEFDALYGFFKSHNPEYLADLKAYCERPRP